MAKSKELASVQPIPLAAELYEVEHTLAIFEKRRDEIRDRLLKSLLAQGVQFVRLENGDGYSVAHRSKLVVKNTRSAQAWALENPEARMKLDTGAALKVAKMGSKIFTVEDSPYLKITRAKDEEGS